MSGQNQEIGGGWVTFCRKHHGEEGKSLRLTKTILGEAVKDPPGGSLLHVGGWKPTNERGMWAM